MYGLIPHSEASVEPHKVALKDTSDLTLESGPSGSRILRRLLAFLPPSKTSIVTWPLCSVTG